MIYTDIFHMYRHRYLYRLYYILLPAGGSLKTENELECAVFLGGVLYFPVFMTRLGKWLLLLFNVMTLMMSSNSGERVA